MMNESNVIVYDIETMDINDSTPEVSNSIVQLINL